MNAVNFLKMTRMNFIPASILPFLAGVLLSGETLSGRMGILSLGFFSVVLGHITANVFNNYYDWKTGADSPKVKTTPFFGGSKIITSSSVSPRTVRVWGRIFFLLSFFCLLVLTVKLKDPLFIFAGLLFLVLAVQYTAPPGKLAYRGLGEMLIFFLFGPGTLSAGYYLSYGGFSKEALLLSLPFAFLILSVIFINEIADADTDRASGKKNLIVRVGRKKAFFLYGSSVLAAGFSIVLNVAYRILFGWATLLLPLYFFLIFKAFIVLKHYPEDVSKLTIVSGSTIFLYILTGFVIIMSLLV